MASSDDKFRQDILDDYRKRVVIAMKALTTIRDQKQGEYPVPSYIADQAIKEMQKVTDHRQENLEAHTRPDNAKPSSSHGRAKDEREYLLGGTL